MTNELWAVVLAAGEGKRMASLTTALYGRELPKQFAALDGERTFLQQTMDRIAPLAPPARTVVVVAPAYEALARLQLRGYPGVHVVVQPENRGTAAGVLLPVAHVLARDPRARIAIFPSDHYLRRPQEVVDAVRRALRAADAVPSGLALVGAAADHAAEDLGWIQCGPSLRGDGARAHRIRRFVEKPARPVATALLRAGALWNTMILAGAARSLWALARRRLPDQTTAFERYLLQIGRPGADEALARLYRALTPADLSRDIVQGTPGLGVVTMEDAGWSDCGTPERLLQSLAGTPALHTLLGRIGRSGLQAGEQEAAAV